MFLNWKALCIHHAWKKEKLSANQTCTLFVYLMCPLIRDIILNDWIFIFLIVLCKFFGYEDHIRRTDRVMN